MLFPLIGSAAILVNYDGSSFSSVAAPVANVTVSTISAAAPTTLAYFNAVGTRYDIRAGSETVGTDVERLDSAFADGDYVTFTITPDPGFQLDISSFTFGGTKGGSSSRLFGIASSVDNNFSTDTNLTYLYAADPGTVNDYNTILLAFNDVDHDLSAYQNLGALTFIVAVDGSNAQRLFNIQVEGTVSPIPEPSTFAAIAGPLGLVVVMMMRRRRR